MIKINKKSLYGLWIYGLLLCLTCSSKTGEYNLEKLKKIIQNIDNDSVLRRGHWALCVKSVQTGKIIIEHNARKTMLVASNIKAITTATALEILGEDFTFDTPIKYSGTISNGILQGSIFIEGSGDPTMGSPLVQNDLEAMFDDWVAHLRKLGVNQITGAVIADEEEFEANPLPNGWLWEDMGNFFGAPAHAINIFDNAYTLYLQPATKLGEKAAIVRTEPKIPDLQFVNEITTASAGTGDQALICGVPYDNLRYLRGTIPMGYLFPIRGSIPDPALLLATLFTEKLKRVGIKVGQPATTTRILKLAKKYINPQRTLVYVEKSPKLKEIVNVTNLYSVNLYAEAILKAIGKKQKKQASTSAGAEAVIEFWKAKGLDTEGMYLTDGSGLSLTNGITALQLAQIFFLAYKLKTSETFYNSLPIAGVSGTMLGTGWGTKAHNNLRAKTGGMTRVISFGGYFHTRRGELMAFSLIANQYTCNYAQMKAKLEPVLVELANIN
ncbi:MAG: D-alanyl-D-alanine carboxypeptidase/D-alanyl-D-alanine-endopeptidase [Microscillaceae bacterium]|nr:D-alanyl-D-alanine carboxypeptidase/D-alanyl-D-alanine-endopeptidase [Microscillaceae bacterium]MDW8461715.1 D-alanyl-D-alanine carboxypeptidase/D-alanyl-D-alanine-endopeptidase [Cytophagales bacterium]